MLKVQIKDASVDTFMVNGKSGQFESKNQNAWVELPSGETRKVRVRVQKGAQPYAVGVYTISDESFGVGKYGDLQVDSLKLVPIAAVKAA